jgi:glycosyltransferase involved in cell wall biosynthesis
VHLRGRVERNALPRLYATADVFVLGSHHEVACFSLIEALSFGVVPVVTDIPPFRRLTGEGRLGALFPPGNAAQLARALERFAGADFASQHHAVRTHFERELSWSAIGPRALEVYRIAAERRRQTPA